MKKLLFGLIAMLVLSFTVKAQSISQATPLTGNTQTITNTATGTLTVKVTDSYEVTSVQVNVTKVSGTIAGKVYMQASLDNVNFSNIDSVTVTDKAVNSKIFLNGINKYLYYKVSYTGVGTMVGTMNGFIVARKRG